MKKIILKTLSGIIFFAIAFLFFLSDKEDIEIKKSQRVSITQIGNGNPIITQAMFDELGAAPDEGANIGGPSVIRVPSWIPPEKRAHPSANYYLYFSHHKGKYIRLAWAETITGPWHLYKVGTNTVIGQRGVLDLGQNTLPIGNGIVIPNNHIASPDVHLDHDRQKIIMYFHSGGKITADGKKLRDQKSFVAESDDGLDFSQGIKPVILGDSYFRVFNHAGIRYAIDNTGNLYKSGSEQSSPWATLSDWDYSSDLWLKNKKNAYLGDIAEDSHLAGDLLPRHPFPFIRENTLYTFYTWRGVRPPERILVSITNLDLTDDYNEWDPSYPPEEVYRARPGWEGGELDQLSSTRGMAPEDVNQLRDPYLFTDIDKKIYLFYTARGENALGVVSIDFND